MPYPWTANDILTAADLNAAFANLPVKRAWVGTGSTTDQTGIASTTTDATGYTVTWTASSTRLYKISATINLTKLTTANLASVYITDAANAGIQAISTTMAINEFQSVTISKVQTGLSGSQTRKIRLDTATGTLTVVNTFSRNGQIVVEDIGPA